MSVNAENLPNVPTELPIPGMTDTGVVDLQEQSLMRFGLDSETALEPPLGTDDRAGDAGAGAVKSGADGEKTDKTQKADEAGGPSKDKAAGADDDTADEGDDLDEDEAAINAAPKEHQATLRKTKESAKFETHFRGSTPRKDVIDWMKKISKAKYDDLRVEVVKDSITDVAHFVEHDLDDTAYAAIANEMVKRDPQWFVQKLTGKQGVKLSDLAEALDARGKQGLASAIPMPDLDSKDDHGDSNMEALEIDWPPAAEYLKAQKRLASGDKAFTTELQTLTERAVAAERELAALKTGKGKDKSGDRATETSDEGEDGQPAASNKPESIAARQAVEVSLGEYVDAHALDKDGLDLAVSDAEAQSAPEVADLKDTMLDAWVDGNRAKKIPSFTNGFFEWAKGKEKFIEALTQVKYYTDRGEKDNAVAESAKLKRYVDQYRKVRIEIPYFKNLNGLINRAKLAAGQTVRAEKVIPGGGSQQPSPNSRKGQQQSDEEIVNSYGLD